MAGAGLSAQRRVLPLPVSRLHRPHQPGARRPFHPPLPQGGGRAAVERLPPPALPHRRAATLPRGWGGAPPVPAGRCASRRSCFGGCCRSTTCSNIPAPPGSRPRRWRRSVRSPPPGSPRRYCRAGSTRARSFAVRIVAIGLSGGRDERGRADQSRPGSATRNQETRARLLERRAAHSPRAWRG